MNPYDPEPLGPVYELWGAYDSDWASCEESRRNVSGVIIYLGRTPIFSKSIRQAGLAASSFSAEMAAGRVFVETMLGFRMMLKSMGIRIKDGSRGFGDNLSQVQNVTLLPSPLRKRPTAIAYHMLRCLLEWVGDLSEDW